MKDEIKEILEFNKNADYKRLSVDEIIVIKDYITNLQEENQRLKKYNKICKKYLHNHERDYVDELGSICCKPSEYFNIAWAQDILNGDIEGFEDLLQGSDK